MKLHELTRAGRTPALPLSLELADGAGPETLQVHRLLRVIPGQRYVGLGEWRDRPVLAKLLVGGKATRHFQRELTGARLLAEQQQTTPQLLASGLQQGEGGWLLFEYLDGSQSLGDAWQAVAQEPPLSDGQQTVLAEALGAIAGLHAKGLWQADLHLDNLLRHQRQLFLIDGGAIRAENAGSPLTRNKVLENLGLFFAQLPASFEPFIEELLVHYVLVNGEHALPLEPLLKEVNTLRRGRLREYLHKLGRDCTEFSVQRGAMGLQVVRRQEEAALQELLADPDAAINAGKALKLGGSSTVALVEVAGRPLVIKRYNIKGVGHWLKRFWRPSRAWHSWVEGHRLSFLGIATPKPLAMLERRWCGLRSRSYLVTEFMAGEDLLTRWQPYLDQSPPVAELQALERLMGALRRERISHGDLKGTNLIWDRNQWAMIDLDAVRQHSSEGSFQAAFGKDRARLLRNWPVESALHQMLELRISNV
ncbi:lipopolysaccharide kinase InaA family protein [Serpens gallinarum]|uniref:Serine/threonine protein kinase n=1 Tax=Serpens gallinarum TaxID=2763075 RepID=A0ABR8TS83_9PSED|nr:lipopolysaccharide kinase InaA family protein [Serpens gallinarum]MBD7978626.1 serine/threonine protein kinase [Serpens gallinarum]